MIPPEEALTSSPTVAGPGANLGMMDMSKCAFFVYVDTDGHAVVQAEGVSKAQAAEWMRHLADSWSTGDADTTGGAE
ncbi:hypothetical protein [Nocardia sp. NBC_01388]|uniref:hypothetical protein n=1 Tax=Nocardia sp. NBC_01388 TaxID=2903596 RepID=UPI00324D8973